MASWRSAFDTDLLEGARLLPAHFQPFGMRNAKMAATEPLGD